ncbi:MAG: MucR family transcriptional regulator, partial [Microvirga sp.]
MDASGSNPADNSNLVELASEIVAAYVSNNSVPTGELPALISEVHAALRTVGTPAAAQPPRGEPAV